MSEPTPEQIEAGIAAFENEPTDAGWLDESDMVRAIYTAMRALERPSDEAVRQRVALAIERADREKTPDGYGDSINHPEISDWGVWLADAAIAAMPEQSK